MGRACSGEYDAAKSLRNKAAIMITIINIFLEDIPEFATQVYELEKGEVMSDIELFPSIKQHMESVFGSWENFQIFSIMITLLHVPCRCAVAGNNV